MIYELLSFHGDLVNGGETCIDVERSIRTKRAVPGKGIMYAIPMDFMPELAIMRYVPPPPSPSLPPRCVENLQGLLDFWVFALWRCRSGGEEVRQKRQKERDVLGDEFTEVHVSKGTVHEERLCFVRVVALRLSRRS